MREKSIFRLPEKKTTKRWKLGVLCLIAAASWAERDADRPAGRAGHHRGAGREGNVERTSPKHKTGIQDFPQLRGVALVRRVIWRLHAVRSDDWIVNWILSLGVDEGICLVNCLNANRFARDAEPCGGVLLSRCLTATSR